jgi:tetratricopeptide (TPR) repeat protein
VAWQAPFDTVARSLDGFAADWARTHAAVCRRTRVEGTQSEDLLDERMRCLARRKQELRPLVDALATVERGSLYATAAGVQALGDPRACGEADVPAAPPPRDPEARRRFDAVLPLLAGARTMLSLKRYQAASDLARAVEQEAAAIGQRALVAEALAARGVVESEARDRAAETTLHEAFRLATELGHDAVVAEVAGAFATREERTQHYVEAMRWIELGLAANARSVKSRATEGQLTSQRATVTLRMGKIDEARAQFEKAIELVEDEPGRISPWSLTARANVALVYFDEERYDDALLVYRKMLELHLELEGPDHPIIPVMEFNIADILLKLDGVDEARALLRRAIPVQLGLEGERSVVAAVWRIVLGEAERRAGDLDAADAACAQALDVLRAEYGDDHGETADAVICQAENLRARGRHAEAAPLYASAVETLRRRSGEESSDFLDALHLQAMDRLEAGESTVAAPLLEEELTRREARSGGHGDPVERAEARFALARALAATDPARAASLAAQARADLTSAGPRGMRRVAAVEQFLAATR